MWMHSRAPHAQDDFGEAEQGYLVSATDLMIGLLFVFIILVVVLALEQKRQQDAIFGLEDPRGTVTNEIGDGMKIALPGIRVDRENGVISLPEDVLFDLGSAQLKPQGLVALERTVGQLSRILPCYVASQRSKLNCGTRNPYGHEIDTIFIEGHTDNIPMRRVGYSNIKLSLDRAEAVKAALVQGTALDEYKNKSEQPLFSYSAYADSRPLTGHDPSDGKNRRVDLRIVLTYKPIKDLLLVN